MKLDKDRVLPIIKSALKEDIGKGDITTAALVDKLLSSDAVLTTSEDCVVCGIDIAEWTMSQIDYSVRFRPDCKDGAFVGAGKELAFIEGHASSILRAERTMINFLSFLSGIATRTKQYVDKVRPYGVKIMDTRKTIPLLRYLEKYAVYTGGGTNHRMGLYDQVLIKDNHISFQLSTSHLQQKKGERTVKEIVEFCRKKVLRGTVLEVEVETLKDFELALAAKPDIIMLDNMRPSDIKACVEIRKLAKVKPSLEASGGITLDNIEEYARTGIDMISVGSLTSSVKSIDMSLAIVR
ncbi:MAG: carboxylating nicotinate-nucleotide diphosphorylase [Candidatus Omnitrophica bacterium]|nr:carboxylating nicotinate-nucleotide diphosphorylase [Candidatus Omnitrophota bacterium]